MYGSLKRIEIHIKFILILKYAFCFFIQGRNGDSNGDGSKWARVIPAFLWGYCTLNPAQVVFETVTFLIALGKDVILRGVPYY